jgi:dipeptidyl aminopeptidase/acylaminoacyl peptidase
MQRHDRRFRKRFGSALLWLAVSLVWPLHAEVREVRPGEDLQLPAGSGLLLVAVDTDIPLQALRIKRNGALFDAQSLKDIAKGRTTRLYVAPAGRYRWDAVRESGRRFELGDDEEYSFEVRAGTLSYPGDLVFRDIDQFNAFVHVANRGLLAMDWMDRTYPELSRGHVLTYMGHYPDPFPTFYRDQGQPPAVAPDAAPAAGALPTEIADLWKPSTLDSISLNPGGDLVAVVEREKRGTQWRWAIRMIDLRGETSTVALESQVKISRIDWSGDRALVVSCGEPDEFGVGFILHVRGDGPQRTYERFKVPFKGVLVDPLPNDPDHILFATGNIGLLGADILVHRLDISRQYYLDRYEYGRTSALDRGLKDDRAWFTDANGQLRAAIVVRDESRVLVHGRPGEFRDVMTLDDNETFSPFALSANGGLVYGWSEKDRAQRDLVELDPAIGRIGRTLFSRPGVDVQAALFDARHNLVGAAYYEDGQLVSEYFDAATKALDARLQRAFPGKTVRIVDRDAASRQFLLLVGGSDQPSEIYHFDVDERRAALLLQTRPWLQGRRFAASQVVRATSKDGFPIEAYLTMPQMRAGASAPLVVLAHGGPVGVRDSRYFDPEVQSLAALGYAVLQVNFRGSEGYGKQFREAGKRNWGTLIEDDIDAALGATLAAHPLDRTRMCAMGSSYGGYSALVSAIRWPDRFRCVVSFAGVSDRMLLFTASDGGRSKEGRKSLEETIGDPRTDAEAMRISSPLYRYRELAVPVLLAHGTEDFRVDYEHTRRLARMLGSAGRPPVLVTLEGEAHGVEDPANQEKLWEAVAAFLRANLGVAPVARSH